MWTAKIGNNAGALWRILDAEGEKNLTSLKKSSKLDDKWLYLALGWLARENKIAFALKKKQMMITLK